MKRVESREFLSFRVDRNSIPNASRLGKESLQLLFKVHAVDAHVARVHGSVLVLFRAHRPLHSSMKQEFSPRGMHASDVRNFDGDSSIS